ncbi:endo-1,4-beta-xylanase [Lihuaxuella thermophila]|uniref:Beta-xylanase n=1 Tax=Lihuaxuella thermophila TaxID=1173111 RepID=A0A1H8CF06_9BACL|nr:endo-1,4-beta-xylanase [Lihuaxuella thermophila]SEM93663.1 endo-1,4-beta-xylanase [Lihuaxuella thermophila]
MRLPVNRALLFISFFFALANICLIIQLINHTAETRVNETSRNVQPTPALNNRSGGTDQPSPASGKQTSLRELAKKKNLLIGTSLRHWPFTREHKYREILYREFNTITIENAMKIENIHPQPDHYNFSESDLLVDFASDHQMKVRGHTLVWDKGLPTWITEGKYSKEETKRILKEHIQMIVSHYKGKVFAWDVVNEAFHDDGTYRDNFWFRSIGPEYIELAFRWAHEADPDALLFYNDYNNEGSNAKSDTIYQMISDFKKRGVPIHGVGFQLHTAIDQKPDLKAISKNMKRLADLNIQVHITELDVKVNKKQAATKEAWDQQAEIYGDLLKTCLSASNCKAFIMWGFTDRHSWLEEYSPLIFDKNYNPKPAYQKLIDILSQSAGFPATFRLPSSVAAAHRS